MATSAPAQQVVRPGPLRWFWYAMGGALPARFSPWVLHDTTTRTWALRHVARSMAQLALPIALVLVLVPGEFWIRGMAALGGVLLGLFFSLAYMPETTENRVKRAGYPAGTATAARNRAAQEREARESERRRAASARRAARYRARQGRP
ncbi:hypothetical protein FHU33_2107 [Blastococcus colisei]|uniref:DUF5313 family protein n=1 Tax=Blastococcus colisei TaxID=1564162 RepID=A0A543PF51_9ACTN|nr:DUF5313 family protein [Blastococcus colisei]TQN42700.1 hypothetical protein FHU33_2107 [Blastococcus colisei]